jgi:hypothetical protein
VLQPTHTRANFGISFIDDELQQPTAHAVTLSTSVSDENHVSIAAQADEQNVENEHAQQNSNDMKVFATRKIRRRKMTQQNTQAIPKINGRK